MSPPPGGALDPPRPLPATYWVVPGRLLVGEHPGSRSRAEAMDRLRRFLAAGVTCFVDLTEPREIDSYSGLLPRATQEGRRVEYLHQPIRDHDVPSGREVMEQVLAKIDAALEAGHVVYLHCRAGLGRSATVAGCWLAERGGGATDPLQELDALWQQSARSRTWPVIPETEAQAEFVRAWATAVAARRRPDVADTRQSAGTPRDRVRGALLGLAAGDAMGAAPTRGDATDGEWTQHTALALCLAESLLETGRCDARDQIERYLRWHRSGHLSATGRPGQPTPDVARALATYQWRRQPMAGAHDPSDRGTASLPRVVSAVAFAEEPAAAVALAAECSRTTHQSPVVLDACRYFAALLAGALRGEPAARLLHGVFEPLPGLWAARPMRKEFVAALGAPATAARPERSGAPDVVHALRNACLATSGSAGFDATVRRAIETGREAALDGALAGALAGALLGATAIPAATLERLARVDLLEQFAERLCSARDGAAAGAPAPERAP
jgi:ADP-ribosylglycohydrolase